MFGLSTVSYLSSIMGNNMHTHESYIKKEKIACVFKCFIRRMVFFFPSG